jgi:hypothetical protein
MKNLSKSNTIKLILSLLVILISFNGCLKTASYAPNYPLSKDGLAYIQLKQGGYFIYRDSTANKVDSVVVTQSSLISYTGTTDFGSIKSYSSQQYILVLTEASPVFGIVWLTGSTQGTIFGFINLTAPDDHFLFRFVSTTDPSIIPSMVVEGKTYANVILTSNSSYDGSGNSYYYWAKGVGLIKRTEVKDHVTNTWTLLRNN